MTTNQAGRLVATALTMALLAVSVTIWRSPQARGTGVRAVAVASLPPAVNRVLMDDAQSAPASASTTPGSSGSTGAKAEAGNSPKAPQPVIAAPTAAPPPSVRQRSRVISATRTLARPGLTSSSRAVHCRDFRWQQDAQRAYVANLRDPWGLDGPPGPSDDDGIACSDLPVDPNRPRSQPVAPHRAPLPKAPPKSNLLRSSKSYYGVFTRQAPFVMSEIDQLTTATGKTPNSVTWFAGWDQAFRADPIVNAWRRGMLPIVSWESRPLLTPMGQGSKNAVDARYRLSRIIAGDFDAYLDKWAADAKALGLPIGLRLDHEMNGFWYPWSEQANGNGPGEFVRAWRHVHDRFTAVGATNIIWVWSPNVIGALKNVSLIDLYPGNDYVDWLGLGGYYRKPIPGKPATFDNTFGESLAALRAVDDKPILLSEIGCTETGGNKPAWIRSLFEALPEQPDIIGLSWFNQTVTAIPIGERLPVTNDWRIDSTPESLAAFRAGIADPRYGSGKPA
jgi:hypothetical protein